MTKKQVSIVFLLVSTVFSVLVMVALIILFTVIIMLLFKEVGTVILPMGFILAMFLGCLISQKAMNFAIKKFNLEEKMDPLFGGKNKRSRLD